MDTHNDLQGKYIESEELINILEEASEIFGDMKMKSLCVPTMLLLFVLFIMCNLLPFPPFSPSLLSFSKEDERG